MLLLHLAATQMFEEFVFELESSFVLYSLFSEHLNKGDITFSFFYWAEWSEICILSIVLFILSLCFVLVMQKALCYSWIIPQDGSEELSDAVWHQEWRWLQWHLLLSDKSGLDEHQKQSWETS